MVSSFILAVTEPRTGFLWSRDEVRGKLPLELLTSRPEKVQSTGWSSRERTGTKGQGQKLAGRIRNCQFPLGALTILELQRVWIHDVRLGWKNSHAR